MVLGSLLLVLGFCLGVETPISATVARHSYACVDVIGPGSLVSGEPRPGVAAEPLGPGERRLAARVETACSPLETGARWVVWGGITLGGLLLLTGWTALRERDRGLVLSPTVG